MVPKLQRLLMLLPTLEADLAAPKQRKGRLLVCSRDVCACANECTLAYVDVHALPAQPLCARATFILHGYGEHAFPSLLRAIASSRTCVTDPVLCSCLLDVLVACSRVLRVGWPSDGATVRASLVLGATRIAGWVVFVARVQRLSNLQIQGVLDLAAHVVVMVVQQTHALHQPLLPLDDMVADLVSMSCELSGGLFSARKTERVSSNVARSLTTLFVSRGFLMSQGLIAQSTAASSAVELARHATVAISRSELRTPQGLAAVRHLLEFLTHMDLSISTHDRVSLVQFVRALHACSHVHPPLSFICAEVVKQQHLQSSGAEEFPAMRVTLLHCLRTALVWMAVRVQVPAHPLASRRELDMMANIAIQVATPTVAYASYGLRRRTRSASVSADLAKPGFLRAMEALIRGTDVRVCPNGIVRALVGAASLAHLILSGPPQTHHDVTVHRALHGLLVTVHKVLLRLSVLEDLDWCSTHMLMVAAVLTNVTRALETHPDAQESYRLGGIVRVCMRTILRRSNARAVERHRLPDLDCDAQWLVCVEDYADRFRGRLLLGCGSLGCTNLVGLLDSLLPTLLCAGCRRVRYCCVACQRRDWAAGGHGGVCGRGDWGLGVD